jgi:hypothetical protein
VTAQALTAADVVTAVRGRYGAETDNIGPEWAALDELSSTGWGVGRRADLFLVRAWAGRPRGHERILVEVKVSRSDLMHELAAPKKMAVFAAYAHRVYFAAPAGLVRPTDDLGPGVGLLEVSGGGTREVRKAVRQPDPEPFTEQLVVEVFRRAARAEARVRTASGSGDAAARVVALRAALTVAERAADTARAAANRDANRLSGWLGAVAHGGGTPCKCGVTLKAAKDMYSGDRRHADGSLCPLRWAEPDYDALAVRLGLVEAGEALAS